MKPIEIHEIPDKVIEYAGIPQNLTFPKQGHTSNVGIIDSIKGRFVIKRTKGGRFSSWLAQEVLILSYLEQTNLLVPKLFTYVEQKSDAWALTEFIPGQTLRSYLFSEPSEWKRHEMIFLFGKMLKEIHSTPCPKEIWTEELWLNRMLELAEYNLQNEEVDGNELLLQKLKSKKPRPCNQTFIHGDFTIDNVLVNDGKISGIIDWSGGALGDPRYDVSLAIRPKPNAFENERDKQVFFEGYGEKIISEEDYKYFEEGLYNFF